MNRLRPARGYTLIEVLASAVIIGIAVSAAVSMSSTLILQEESSWRTTVALNYQENAAKLWQCGLTPFEVNSLMPGTAGNPPLANALANSVTTTELGTLDADGVGVLETATNTVQINNISSSSVPGGTTTVDIFRPTTR